MAKKRYQPPTQAGIGQFFDSIFIMALVFSSLYLSLKYEDLKAFLGFGGGEQAAGDAAASAAAVTWESLGQNPTMQAQWEKLGYTVDSAAEIINAKFDYSIDPVALIVTAVVVIGYFVFLFKVSDKEYRDVIGEKFDN